MNIYLIKRKDGPIYDETSGLVIVADAENRCREVVFNELKNDVFEVANMWLREDLTTIIKVGEGDGPARVVLRDILEG